MSFAPPGGSDLSKSSPGTVAETTLEELDSRSRRALGDIRSIVGSEHVIHELDPLERHSRDTIPRTQRPAAFIYPGSVEEVTALVKLANQYKLPIWPVSKGKNWGYGAATPARSGGIVMVLERLNRIIEINTEMAYVIVEPGVTYRQLHQHLHERQIALWVDCTDGPADGSVMGNALERGIGETDYGDHFGNICGLEAVLPDGSLIRTGGGPFEGFKSWNTYKWGVGPYVEGLFSQGNYGIVTKMGLWLMPKPEYFISCVFELDREDDFPALIDAMRRLQLMGAIKSKVHLVNDVVTFAVLAEPGEIIADEGLLSDASRVQLRKRFKVAPWSFAAGLYGTRDQVRANVALLRRELGSLGRLQLIDDRKIRMIEAAAKVFRNGMRFAPTRALAKGLSLAVFGRPVPLLEMMPHLHAIEKGHPSDHFVKHAYYKSRRPKPKDGDIDPARDECGLIWLGPMVPLNGRDTLEVLDLVRPLYRKHGFDFTAALIVGNPRTAVALMSVFYDKQDLEETRRAESLYFEMGEVTQKAGYQQYRTSTMFMDRILNPAPEFQAFCNRIKSALDPNGILAPGKYGIHTSSGSPAARKGEST